MSALRAVLMTGAVVALATATSAAARDKAADKEWLSTTAVAAFDLCAPDLGARQDFEARVLAAGWPAFKPVRGIPVAASAKRLRPDERKSPAITVHVSEGRDMAFGSARGTMTECRVFAPDGGAVALIDRYGAVYGDETSWWAKRAADGTVNKLPPEDRAAGLEALVAGLQPGERLITVNIGFEGKSLVADTGIFEKTN